jgi:hypothetical protein
MLLSVAVIVTEKVLVTVGVPLNSPLFGSMLSPAGSPLCDQA